MGFWEWMFGASSGDTTARPLSRTEWLAQLLDTLDPYDLPSVVAGRQLIADTAATMQLVSRSEYGADNTRTPGLLRRPDPREPYRTTIERICNSMTHRRGMALLRCTLTDAWGHWSALEVIDPHRWTYRTDQHRTRIDAIDIDSVPQDMNTLHVIHGRLDDSPIGTSPLHDVEAALEMLVGVYRFSSEYYGSAAVPPYALVYKHRLHGDQPNEQLQAWLAARRERRPALLSGGEATLETFQAQSADDALLLDAMDYLDAVVARVLQQPPSLLNVRSQGTLTYSTTQGELSRWLQLGLYPGTLARIEAAFSELLPPGQLARFDTSNLVRMDLKTRVETAAAAVAGNLISQGEGRVWVGLDPVPDERPAAIDPIVEGIR